IDGSLARRHPVDVAAQRVDLPIMRHHPERMGERPAREGVRREALMHEREGAFETRIAQIRVVSAELRGQHHAFVDGRAAGDRNGVEAPGAQIVLLHVVDGPGDLLAQDIEAALEFLLARNALAAPDEGLQMQGLGRLDALTEVAVVDRRLAEAEKHLALIGDRLLARLAAEPRCLLLARKEKMPDRIVPGLGKLETERRAFLQKETMRDLY